MQSMDIPRFTDSQSFSLNSLTHLKLTFWEDKGKNLGEFLRRSEITHVITASLLHYAEPLS